MSQVSIIDITSQNPQIPTEFITDNGTAIPIANQLEILTEIVAADSLPLETTGSGNTVTINAQISQAIAASDATKIGLSAFDSTQFTVDANGFVGLVGGGGGGTGVDTIFTDVAGPVSPNGDGELSIFGEITTAHSVPLETDGSIGNTVQIIAQVASSQAATDINDAGMASFNSTMFSVDANGFVGLIGGGVAIDSVAVQTGTSPVVPTAAGLITVNGATVAAGTNPVRTDGTGANTYAVEVQISQALAATDATKIGLSNFDSAAFDVDANGFVQLNGGGVASTSFEVQSNTGPGTDPVVPTAAGVITVNGAAVANHSVVLESHSRAANSYNLEIQYATSAAATNATKSGVAHFDSADFTVDANGFVTLASTGAGQTITGDSGGALSPTAGNWNILGSSSAAGTSPVTTAGAVSTLTVKVQTSQAIAATDATKIGLASFDSADFTVDANGFVSLASSGGEFEPNATINQFDDFIGAHFGGSAFGTAITSIMGWVANNMQNITVQDSGHPGIIVTGEVDSGATGSSIRADELQSRSIMLGGGVISINFVFKIVTASNSTNRYTLRFGLSDSISAPTNGLYFEYSDNINSGNWNIKATASSVTTTTSTATSASTGWHNGKITVNAAGNSAEFFMDGVSLGTIATNVPTAGISPNFGIVWSAGTVPESAIYIDLFYMTQALTTAR